MTIHNIHGFFSPKLSELSSWYNTCTEKQVV